MFAYNQPLVSPADFDNAMFFAIPVTVYQQNEVIDYGGVIEKHTEHAVLINGNFYFKDLCQFKVRRVSMSK
ncbi:hypothetical protein [Paenibacillus elgii]|uniref:hypothetical protein n=1 Tax=Paenibacillus elgii TaxID=189691 RepID=UPI0020421591|nr:hypothetical protein [Paenibacillus elgii]MCM3271140.1 hypothetical protein [Paenibacillus elgii]